MQQQGAAGPRGTSTLRREQQGRFTYYPGGMASELEEAFPGPRCEGCVLKVTQLVNVLRPPHEVALQYGSNHLR